MDRTQFLKSLKPNQILIIKAEASWCKPCKEVQPLVDELLTQIPLPIKMISVDVDKQRNLASYFKITQVPTFISYLGHDRMDIQVGSDEYNVRNFFKKVQLLKQVTQK